MSDTFWQVVGAASVIVGGLVFRLILNRIFNPERTALKLLAAARKSALDGLNAHN